MSGGSSSSIQSLTMLASTGVSCLSITSSGIHCLGSTAFRLSHRWCTMGSGISYTHALHFSANRLPQYVPHKRAHTALTVIIQQAHACRHKTREQYGHHKWLHLLALLSAAQCCLATLDLHAHLRSSTPNSTSTSSCATLLYTSTFGWNGTRLSICVSWRLKVNIVVPW